MGTLLGTRESWARSGRAGKQRLPVPCSATPFCHRPEGTEGLVTLCAWKAPQAATRPHHGREGVWSSRPAARLPAKAKRRPYPLPQRPAANMAPLYDALLTESGLSDSVTRLSSNRETVRRLGCLW